MADIFLPPPPAVMAILNGDYDPGDFNGMRLLASEAYGKWLPQALAHAHTSKELKHHARRLLGVSDFILELQEIGVWDTLKSALDVRMNELGAELHRIYQQSGLRALVGGYEADLRSRQLPLVMPGQPEEPTQTAEDSRADRQDCQGGTPLPPSVDWASSESITESDERCVIHYLRLIAVAVDEAFLSAVNEALATPSINKVHPVVRQEVEEKIDVTGHPESILRVAASTAEFTPRKNLLVGGKTFHSGIKGYERMRIKMMSAADHRHALKPRPAKNVDINRCLAVVEDGEAMLAVFDGLRARFGPWVKFKNGMALPDNEAESIFHLRLCMVSILFEHPILPTFGELRSDPTVQELWRVYKEETEPPASTPWGQWESEITRALEWLHSDSLTNEPVRIVCEVQCLLRSYRDVRFQMHEVYKAARCPDPGSLIFEFEQYSTQTQRQQEFQADGNTTLKAACRDGDIDTLEKELAAAENTRCVAEALGIACKHSRRAVVEIILNTGRVGVNDDLGGGWTALLRVAGNNIGGWRAQHERPSIVSLLLAIDNVDVNKKNVQRNGASPLFMACTEGHIGVVQLLLEFDGIDPNQGTDDDGATPLFMSAMEGHLQITELLASAPGIDVNRPRTDDGGTALFVASMMGNSDTVAVLLGVNGIEVNVQTTDEGATPLFVAAHEGHIKVVQLLLATDTIDIHITNNLGQTPLDAAKAHGHDTVAALIENFT